MRDLRACSGVFASVPHVQNLFPVAEPEGRDPGGSEVELVDYPLSTSPGW